MGTEKIIRCAIKLLYVYRKKITQAYLFFKNIREIFVTLEFSSNVYFKQNFERFFCTKYVDEHIILNVPSLTASG